jgi:hypothetical protein
VALGPGGSTAVPFGELLPLGTTDVVVVWAEACVDRSADAEMRRNSGRRIGASVWEDADETPGCCKGLKNQQTGRGGGFAAFA